MSAAIPRDQWEAVAQLGCDIVNASRIDDQEAARRHYRRLEAYVRGQVENGRSNAFILESLGDFTHDNRKAIALYRRALTMARRRGTAGQTILLELGKRHLELKGKLSLAKRYLRAAWFEARRRGDREVASQAMQLATAQAAGETSWEGTLFHSTARRTFRRG